MSRIDQRNIILLVEDGFEEAGLLSPDQYTSVTRTFISFPKTLRILHNKCVLKCIKKIHYMILSGKFYLFFI